MLRFSDLHDTWTYHVLADRRFSCLTCEPDTPWELHRLTTLRTCCCLSRAASEPACLINQHRRLLATRLTSLPAGGLPETSCSPASASVLPSAKLKTHAVRGRLPCGGSLLYRSSCY